MSGDGRDLLKTLAQALGKLPNHVAIERHTDSKPYPPTAAYTNWELSADRANAARRLMTQNGFREDQVEQVRGLADQRLRKRDAPLDPLNRRSSLMVQSISRETDWSGRGNEAGASAEKSAQGHGKQESTGGGEPAAPKKE